jgi:transposase
MQTKQKRPSERFKRKVLARWRWLAARGVDLERAALEIGVSAAELRAWSQEQVVEAPLFVPVQVEVESAEQREIVVVLAGGVRVEGLSVADVAELVRRLS